MKTPRSLSYSSLSLFEKDIEEFYMRYLADKAAPRLPQEPPMAVGSAFDAFVKAALHSQLFGVSSNPQFEFGAIFESQVEPQCRDFALKAGKHIWKCYKLTGAYEELFVLLQRSIEPPRFEFKVEGLIGGAPFLGKPDCRFVLDLGDGPIHVILDWKVHGYCSKYGASPSKGYMLCRDGYLSDKPSRSHCKEHANFLGMNYHGLLINSGYMEGCNNEYADQLCLYGWLLDEAVGDENVVLMIDEIVAKYMGPDVRPLLRVANHRGRVSKAHQNALVKRVARCWTAITSGHVFTDMTPEESRSRCEVLDNMAGGLMSDGSVKEDFFAECVRTKKW